VVAVGGHRPPLQFSKALGKWTEQISVMKQAMDGNSAVEPAALHVCQRWLL
jgi:hypothetical protein